MPRVSMWIKRECFSVEDDGLLKILQHPNLLVASRETSCKVAQRQGMVSVLVGEVRVCLS